MSTITDIPPDLDKKDDTDAILALVFGVIGFAMCQVLAPIALIFVWRHYRTRQTVDGNLSIMAIIGGVFGLIGSMILGAIMAYFLFMCAIYVIMIVVYVVMMVVMVGAVGVGVALDPNALLPALALALAAL